jgi:capsular polysaccharide transport system permease protein
MNKKIWKHILVKNELFTFIVLLPFLLFSIYTIFVAKPRYLSDSSIVIQNISSNQEIGGMGALLASMQGIGTSDLLLVKEHIASSDMMEEVDKKYHILDHWHNQGIDILYKLWNQDYREKSLNYYRSKVKTMINTETGTLQISVEAFDPQVAKDVLEFILLKSEEFVNKNGHKAANEQLHFLNGKLVDLKNTLDQSRQKLIEYQKAKNFFNPSLEIEQQARKVGFLEESKIRLEAEYNAKKTFLSEDSPQMVTLKETISYMDNQLSSEKKKMIGDKDAPAINNVTDEYKMIEGELALHMEAYKTALIFNEKVKFEAARKLKQIMIISSPKLPQYAIYPEKILNIFYCFIILTLSYGLINLLKGIVKEHK